MNKIEKIQKELKVRFGLVTVTAATIFSLGACGNTNTNTNQNTPSTPSTTVEVDNPVETTDPVEVEPVETTDPVEVEPVEETFTVTADQINNLVETQAVSHTHIPKEEILAVAMSFNWDYITDEDKDIIMNTYGVSLDDLNEYFVSFINRDSEMFNKYGAYYYGMYSSIEPEYDIKNWINYSDFAFNNEDAELVDSIGNTIEDYNAAANIDKEKSSFNYTLYYVSLPNFALSDEYKMEYTVFTQPENTIVK